MLSSIKTVGVIGSGIMGAGIAQVAATAGYPVIFCDVAMEVVEKGLKGIRKQLDRDVSKNKITLEDCDAIFGRIQPAVDIQALSGADFVFEAIIEKMDIKRDLYARLAKICSADCIFATNTSGLSITEIAAATDCSERFVGMHFFNPVPVMKLVEVIRGYDTSDKTFDLALAMAKDIGKESISVKEAPLFAVNRILVPMLNEAIFVFSEGIASAEDIDKGMMLGCNHPIGPLALADMVGLDTLLLVAQTLFRETGDSKYRPCPLLIQMVRAGHFGRKTGQGFYTYT